MRLTVSRERLEKIAIQVPREAPRAIRTTGQALVLEDWLRDHGLSPRGPKEWRGGRLYVFDVCPWNPAHTDRSAYVIQHASGALDAACHHDGCADKDWHALRDLYEPGWRQRSKDWSEPRRPDVSRPNSLSSLNSSTASAESPAFSSLNSLDSSAPFGEEPGWPAPLADEAFHGVAGEIIREVEPETEADEAALLLNLLVTFGNAIGRNPYASVGRTQHYPNLFVGLVGHTGDARKGTSWDPIHDLFERALPIYTAEHIQGSVATGEGLIALVRDRYEKRVQIKDKKTGRMTMEFDTVIEDEGVSDKRLLIVDSEMSGILKVMNRSGNILSEQMRKAWETGTMQNLNKNSPMKATGAHISIIGHITPSGLQKHLTEAEAANGFGNRFMWMLSKRSKLLPEGGNLPHLNSFISSIRELVQQASDIREVRRHAYAAKIWAAVYGDLNRPGVGMFGELTARRAPIVLRLSLIYAVLDGVRTILAPHLMAALAVWERSEASVRFLFGDATGDPTADALHEAMLNRPEGATRTDLHAALGRNRPASEIDRALTALQRAGRAQMVRQKGEGNREVEAWYARDTPGAAADSAGYLTKARQVLAEIESGTYEDNEFNENSEADGSA